MTYKEPNEVLSNMVVLAALIFLRYKLNWLINDLNCKMYLLMKHSYYQYSMLNLLIINSDYQI